MSSKTKPEKRSPLKRKPLRNAGDSVQEELDNLFYGDFLAYALAAVFTIVMAGWEWWRFYAPTPPQPIPLTILAAAAVAIAWFRWRRLLREAAPLKLGRDGEKTVAQYLEQHRQTDWSLINDIPGDHFNVDHVLVAPGGVFVLETKTRSKPAVGDGRDAKIVYDGEALSVGGHSPDPGPIIQARAERDWIRDILSDTTGRRVAVRGIVVFPGWFVERSKTVSRPDIWVCNEKTLVKWVANEPDSLSAEDVALYVDRLRRRITGE